MRASLVLLLMLLVPDGASAQMIECEPSPFGFFKFTCKPIGQPASKAASFCDVMNRQGGAFRWSHNDTDGTKDRADLINAAGKRLCGWKK